MLFKITDIILIDIYQSIFIKIEFKCNNIMVCYIILANSILNIYIYINL